MQGEAEGASAFGRWDWLALAALLLVTVAVFARALAGELVHDDLELIASNPGITDLGDLRRIVTAGSWDFLGPREAEFIGHWRPLTALAYALVWPLARSEPTLFHGLSLAFHLAATVAAFLLARRLVSSQAPSCCTWLAAATAALFALHPAQVENVAWVSALNGPLSGCLVLFALERFLAWRARGSHGIPLSAVTLFSFALLAKEMAVALLPLVVAVDLLRPSAARDGRARPAAPPLGGFDAPSVPARAYGGFAAAFGLYLVARMLVFHSPWGGLERAGELSESALRLVLLRLEVFGGALEILTVPIELDLLRPFRPHIELADPALVRAAVFTAVYLALVVASLRARARLALTALAFLPLGFLPVLTHVQALGAFPLAERFLYLPVFGFGLGVALLLAQAFGRRTATLVLLGLVAAYAGRSFTRTRVWHDEEALFRATAASSPRSVVVWTSLGRALLRGHLATHDAHTLAEAQAAFERAADLLEESARDDHTDLLSDQRDYLNVNLGLAACALQAGDFSAAILMLENLAQRIESIQAGERAARERGLEVRGEPLELERVYTVLGSAQLESGQLAESERSFGRALELHPDSAEAHQNRGRLFARSSRWQEAVNDFEASARLRPGNPEDRLLLAQALLTLGASERAETLAHELLAELPQDPAPLIVLAVAAQRRGDSGAALTWLERALALDPRHALAWSHKARLLLARGDGAGALSAFRNAIDLDPANFEAHYELAGALLAQGALAEARPYLVQAYTLAPREHREPLRRNLDQSELDEAALRALARADVARAELESALHWIERLLAGAPGNAGAGLERARLLRRLARDEEALAAFRTAAERAPTSFEIWSELGTYLHALERSEEARPVLEHALELEVPLSYPPELRASSKQRLREMIE